VNVYVAGPMRGREDFNFPAFNEAAASLRARGHTVFNPAERDVDVLGVRAFKVKDGDERKVKGFSLREALHDDTAWITLHADAIALLDGWADSKGATAEACLGWALGIQVAPLASFLAPVHDH